MTGLRLVQNTTLLHYKETRLKWYPTCAPLLTGVCQSCSTSFLHEFDTPCAISMGCSWLAEHPLSESKHTACRVSVNVPNAE